MSYDYIAVFTAPINLFRRHRGHKHITLDIPAILWFKSKHQEGSDEKKMRKRCSFLFSLASIAVALVSVAPWKRLELAAALELDEESESSAVFLADEVETEVGLLDAYFDDEEEEEVIGVRGNVQPGRSLEDAAVILTAAEKQLKSRGALKGKPFLPGKFEMFVRFCTS